METYDAILQRMKASYESYAGFTPPEESDVMIRLRVLAGEVYQLRVNEEYIARQLFPSTATGEYLDRHAAERGLTRRSAETAAGSVTFTAQDTVHPDILIPAGTEVCTYADMLRFTTVSDVVLTSGNSTVSADAAAVSAGAAYNARVGTVSLIVTPIPGIGSVTNSAAFTGGADAESDDQLRRRVIDSYVNIVSGANAAYYKSLALSVPGVYSASVVGRGRGNGTVDVYISGVGEAVTTAVKNQVQTLISAGRELNVDVLVRDPTAVPVALYILLTVEAGYDFTTVADEVDNTVSAYINALGIGADVLLSKVGEIVGHVKGVADYHFVESYGGDRIISDSRYPVAGTILVEERG